MIPAQMHPPHEPLDTGFTGANRSVYIGFGSNNNKEDRQLLYNNFNQLTIMQHNSRL